MDQYGLTRHYGPSVEGGNDYPNLNDDYSIVSIPPPFETLDNEAGEDRGMATKVVEVSTSAFMVDIAKANSRLIRLVTDWDLKLHDQDIWRDPESSDSEEEEEKREKEVEKSKQKQKIIPKWFLMNTVNSSD